MRKYGKYSNDGSVEYEPTHCILSSRPLLANQHTTRERVTGTRYYYRVLSKYLNRVSAEDRAKWSREIPTDTVVNTKSVTKKGDES